VCLCREQVRPTHQPRRGPSPALVDTVLAEKLEVSAGTLLIKLDQVHYLQDNTPIWYLPFNIVLTYTIGTLLRLLADWKKGKQFSEEVGIPIAAGFIIGESLVGVGFALYYIFAA